MTICLDTEIKKVFPSHTVEATPSHPLCRLAAKIAPSAAAILAILAISTASACAFLLMPLALTHVVVPAMLIIGLIGIVAVLIMVVVTFPTLGPVLTPLALPFVGLLIAVEMAPAIISVAAFVAPIGAAASLGLGIGSAVTIALSKAIQMMWPGQEAPKVNTPSVEA